MSELTEVFPIVAGVIIGVLVLRIRTSRMRTIALVGLSILFGVLASFISGELFVSWDFLFVDHPAGVYRCCCDNAGCAVVAASVGGP